MKIIKYLFNGSAVEMGWNEANEETAKAEADDGMYTIEEVADPVVEPTADDVLNALLGVMQ